MGDGFIVARAKENVCNRVRLAGVAGAARLLAVEARLKRA